MLKEKFLKLGISEVSLKRKLSDIGLSIEDLSGQLSDEQFKGVQELFVYFAERKGSIDEGKELIIPERSRSSAIGKLWSDLTNDYDTIIIDTNILQSEASVGFLLDLEEIVTELAKSRQIKIYVLDSVLKEIERNKSHSLKKSDFSTYNLIKENLDIIERLSEKGFVQDSIETKLNYRHADLEIFQIYDYLSTKDKKNGIIILTNDKPLQFDLYQRFMRLSVSPGSGSKTTQRPSMVARIEKHVVRDEDRKTIRKIRYVPVIRTDNFILSLYDIEFKDYLVNRLFVKQEEVKLLSALTNSNFFSPELRKEHQNKEHKLVIRKVATRKADGQEQTREFFERVRMEEFLSKKR